MGEILQLVYRLGIAAAVFAVLLLAAFLVRRLFESPKTRKRIILGTTAMYLACLIACFGFIAFILSGNLN
ncbi:hypothetical protein SAMN05421771_4228 [Granulicella pectinivorans]|jgi:hypothetical protein|uniref:Uncharacterized protein n=2 Tax=Granulicella pectinivorans TaxID=474950 RepID=A0A1I6N0V7_9BACT|nr:hypothetical protein SAMN05421771_4228 [Granulicella pectinivorans]